MILMAPFGMNVAYLDKEKYASKVSSCYHGHNSFTHF